MLVALSLERLLEQCVRVKRKLAELVELSAVRERYRASRVKPAARSMRAPQESEKTPPHAE